MIIKNITIQNFRSYGPEGFTLSFSDDTNTLIGENNIGKTTIVEDLKRILTPEHVWDKEDYHARDLTKEIRITIDCLLDDGQIQKIIRILELPYSVEFFKNNFAKSLQYSFHVKIGSSLIKIKLGELNIEGPLGFVGERLPNETINTFFNWSDIIRWISEHETILPINAINYAIADFKVSREYLKDEPRIVGFAFPTETAGKLVEVIKEKVVILEEFREKPQSALNDLSSSPNGRDLVSVLFYLKNGEIKERKKYTEIQKKFSDIFPHLKIEIIASGGQYRVEIQKNHIASTTFYIGSGIIQVLFILSHVIAHPDKILVIDTPELQLHPHIQRMLGRHLQLSKGSQIILLTHSQYFLPVSKESRIIRFIQENGITRTIYPEEEYFTPSDFNIYDQILTIDNKEFFFSRFVLLVEGLSDQWVMQEFSSAEGFDLDEHGISIVPVNGNQNFIRYPKILEGYEIPWMIMADTDNEKKIIKTLEKVKSQFPKAEVYLLTGEIENILDKKMIIEGKRLFGEGSDSKNKPLVDRYAAKKMLENKLPIPDEIKEVIHALKRELGGVK
jgi:predicted ATP-dependent endonuclease of OLD family